LRSRFWTATTFVHWTNRNERDQGMNGLPTPRSTRTRPTERGIAYRGRPPWQQNRHSSQRVGKPRTRQRAVGGQDGKEQRGMRNAERRNCPAIINPLESRVLENWHARFGEGRMEKANNGPRQPPTPSACPLTGQVWRSPWAVRPKDRPTRHWAKAAEAGRGKERRKAKGERRKRG